MSKAVRLRWAAKVAQARYFVILTDKESVISLEGIDPESFSDVIALQSQAFAVEDFLDRLKELKDRHDKAIEKLEGKNAASRKKVTKIKVREG